MNFEMGLWGDYDLFYQKWKLVDASFTGLKQFGERYVKIVGSYDNYPALQLGMKLAKISIVLCDGLNRSYCHTVQRTLPILAKNS